MADRPTSSYIFGESNQGEVVRLMRQHQGMTKYMGGLFPKGIEPSIHRLLDIACGPGGWAVDVARQFPHAQVVGIDIDPAMIAAARNYALAESITNAAFLVMDARHLDFNEGEFDCINIRFAQSFLSQNTWKSLLEECFRLLAPGGSVIVTDYEFSVSTSSAESALTDLLSQTLWKAKRSYSRHSFGITVLMRQILTEKGFVQLFPSAYVYDVSGGGDYSSGWLENFTAMFAHLFPFLLASGQFSEEELNHLFEQARAEMSLPDYCGALFVMSWVARKPGMRDQETPE